MRTYYTDWSDVPVILNTAHVAKLLGLTVRVVQKMSLEGKLPAYRVGSSWRYNKADIMKAMGVTE